MTLTLPDYPRARTRQSLPDSDRSTLNNSIQYALTNALALAEPESAAAAGSFISSFAQSVAEQTLESLIQGQQHDTQLELVVRKSVLRLAERLAHSQTGLPCTTLLDLAIVYGPTHPETARNLFIASLKPSLIASFQTDVVSSYLQLLSSNPNVLCDIRKIAECISSVLHVSPPELIRPFYQNKEFMLTLSSVYDTGLTSVARADSRAQSLAQHVASPHTILDDWERLYLESKVALIDSFHVLIITMLRDMSSGAQTEHDLDRSFDTLFSLVQASSSPPPPSDRVPYLNQSLLADYQHAYGLSRMLTSSLQHIAESDARIDALDAELRSLDVVVTDQRDPAGALRPLVHLKNLRAPVAESHGSALDQSKGKGKDVQIPADDDNDNDPDLDAKVSRVLDVLPDHAPEYVRALLTHPDYPFRGDAEKVLDALLTDTAPSPQDLPGVARGGGGSGREGLVYAKDRKNVWDDEVAEISQAHVGKRRQEEGAFFLDRTHHEQMKSDILRRVEEMASSEQETRIAEEPLLAGDTGKGRTVSVAYLDDSDIESAVGLRGDGEDSDAGEDEDDHDEAPGPPADPERILVLAYTRDPKLFDRDAHTRRNKARADLKAATGWGDEQIEGWRIMLDRNSKKDGILLKYEFAGNRPLQKADDRPETSHTEPGPPSGAGGSRGRGGRGRGGRDRGRGKGNHNRKRGHDRKIARAGGVPGPSE